MNLKKVIHFFSFLSCSGQMKTYEYVAFNRALIDYQQVVINQVPKGITLTEVFTYIKEVRIEQAKQMAEDNIAPGKGKWPFLPLDNVLDILRNKKMQKSRRW